MIKEDRRDGPGGGRGGGSEGNTAEWAEIFVLARGLEQVNRWSPKEIKERGGKRESSRAAGVQLPRN